MRNNKAKEKQKKERMMKVREKIRNQEITMEGREK